MSNTNDTAGPVFNSERYEYCKECDIWYPKEYKEKADKLRAEKVEKKLIGIAMMIEDCPLCAIKGLSSFKSMVTSEESAQCRRLTSYRPRLRPKRGEKQFIFLDKKE